MERIKKVSTDKAPKAIGPYSQAVIVGEFVYTSGQIAIDPETNAIESDSIVGQAEQVMKNLAAVLESVGTTLDKTVKTTCFLADMADFAAFNEVYSKYITNAPARSCIAVKSLPKGALVEVDLIALI